MCPALSIFLLTVFSVGYACIPTVSPDDRPDIPGVFTTTTTPNSLVTTTTADIVATITTPPTTMATTPTTTSTTTTTTTTSTTTTTTTPVCPVGWDLFVHPTTMEASCFMISTGRLLWPAARDACVALGAHLAVVHSSEENNFLTALSLRDLPPAPPAVYSLYEDSPWIGMSCTLGPPISAMRCGGGTTNWSRDSYMNVDGSPADYANWSDYFSLTGNGQPDHDCGYTQIIMTPSSPNLFGCCEVGKWHDMPCSFAFMSRYICERPPL